MITICQELQDTVVGMGAGDRSLLIENVMGGDVDEPPSSPPAGVRTTWGIGADAPLALYTGTFEAYQGVELLIDAAALVAKRRPEARVLVVGGEPAQVDGRESQGRSRWRGGDDDLHRPAAREEKFRASSRRPISLCRRVSAAPTRH